MFVSYDIIGKLHFLIPYRMNASVQARFYSTILSDTDVTGRLPDQCTLPVNYAHAREIKVNEGVIWIQKYSNYLFFIEFYEFHLNTALKASYVIEEPTFFLFLMLEGNINFSDTTGSSIAEAGKGIFYATYNRKGEYFVNSLPPGVHRFCYITPRTEWLETRVHKFPSLEGFITNFRHDKRQYAHMPSCLIDAKAYKLIMKLLKPEKIKGVDLEAQILNRTISLFKLYDQMVATGAYIRSYDPKERIRLVKKYIDDTAKDIKTGEIPKIADKFFFTRRTLTRVFKKEVGITLLEYIQKSKLEYALKLLKENKLSISEISIRSGFSDQNYFSRIFRKQFGISPKNASKQI